MLLLGYLVKREAKRTTHVVRFSLSLCGHAHFDQWGQSDLIMRKAPRLSTRDRGSDEYVWGGVGPYMVKPLLVNPLDFTGYRSLQLPSPLSGFRGDVTVASCIPSPSCHCAIAGGSAILPGQAPSTV